MKAPGAYTEKLVSILPKLSEVFTAFWMWISTVETHYLIPNVLKDILYRYQWILCLRWAVRTNQSLSLKHGLFPRCIQKREAFLALLRFSIWRSVLFRCIFLMRTLYIANHFYCSFYRTYELHTKRNAESILTLLCNVHVSAIFLSTTNVYLLILTVTIYDRNFSYFNFSLEWKW